MAGDKLNVRDHIGVRMDRKRQTEDKLPIKGKFKVEHWREGKLLNTYEWENTVVNVGKNALLDVKFNSASQVSSSSWYIGLISLASFGAGVVVGDTMASHAGWTEFTGYSEANRQAWGQGASSGQSVTNGSPATFTANTTGTVKGIFVTSSNTKGGTTGELWSGGLFPGGDVPVANTDQLKITYTVSC